MSFSIKTAFATFTLVASTAVLSAASLEQFLGAFEACKASETFQDYADRLGSHFANPCCEPGAAAADPRVTITPPAEIAAVAGKPTSTNYGEYTEVTLPITGTYEGIPVSLLVFSFGNENGIFAARLQFDAPRAIVFDRFGAAVRSADAAGSAAWETDGYGYSARIPDGEAGAIICDWSV